ncbi:thiamine biosynthetic bifunctional enzyme [Pleosporales sp. CAS-2024a]
MKDHVDYSLYLVTDSTHALLGARDVAEVVDQAVAGGVTMVQYRDKTGDTALLVATAKRLHEKCKAHNVPLLVNDRVDVALAVGCEGVHLGQEDLDVAAARQLLGDAAIIGATVSSMQEARIAVERGADYLGIGTLYATTTKKNTKQIIGINGIRSILAALDQGSPAARKIKTVCIGGVNASNLQRIKHQLHAPRTAATPPKSIDGVAVVSAIMAAADPKAASAHLSALSASLPPFAARSTAPPVWHGNDADETTHLLHRAVEATQNVQRTRPLSHNMTNLVVQNFAANVALAIGASPIMANYAQEAADLAALGGALVVNMGTVTPDGIDNYKKAILAYNLAGAPIVLDPVGAGATAVRRAALRQVMAVGYFDLIKGNEREIMAVARASGFAFLHEQEEEEEEDASPQQQRGVDSGAPVLALEQKALLVQRLALRERNLVLMTGPTDVLSDGVRTYAIDNGHDYLAAITGSGCTLGTTLSAYLAANHADKLHAAVAALLHFEIAAELAAARDDVNGPGTFVPAFIDQLYRCAKDIASGEKTWHSAARIRCLREIPHAALLLKEL